MDIEEAEIQQRALETQLKVMGMTFATQWEAYMFYNNYAKDRGFSIRKDKVKRGKGLSNTIRYRRYVCARAGKRLSKFLNPEGRTRRLRPETRSWTKDVEFGSWQLLWMITTICWLEQMRWYFCGHIE